MNGTISAVMRAIIDRVYPVGIIIDFAVEADPNNAVGCGTQWQRIADGRTLIASDGSHPVGWAGGEATLRSYAGSTGRVGTLADVPASHWQFLDNRLLPFFATETHFFVHAGVDPALAMEDQPLAVLYECPFSDPKPHCSGKIMVCGHTAQKSGVPLVTGHAICLETWCSGRGWLSCLDLGSGLVHQANQGRATRVVRLPAPG